MRQVTFEGRGGLEVHTIYSEDEAQAHGLAYLRDWHTAAETGQWILTDDGFVVELLSIGWDKKDRVSWIRTCTGAFAGRQKVTTEERECRWTFSGKFPRGGATKANAAFARLVAHGMDLTEAYLQTHPRASNPDKARERALRLLETEMVRKIVAEELDDVLKELNLDKRFVLQHLKTLASHAEMETVQLGALKELKPLVGLEKPKELNANHTWQGIPASDIAEAEIATEAATELPAAPVTIPADLDNQGEPDGIEMSELGE